MKVKVISDRKIIEKELDLEYPYHLYFQDEDCLNDELHRVCEKYTIIVKNGIHYNTIERVVTRMQDEYIILNNLTTEEHFFECYDNVNMNIHNATKRIYNNQSNYCSSEIFELSFYNFRSFKCWVLTFVCTSPKLEEVID